ncbi:MAG: winged helix-turn-helix domain-containing protein [Rhizomicrobium sp.]
MLLQSGKSLRISSRALDILILLTRRAGEVVPKDEIIAHTWPSVFVEESNLRVHMVTLRKVLNEGKDAIRYIANVPGRGYSFVAPLAHIEVEDEPVEHAEGPPAASDNIVGRAEFIESVVRQLPKRRLVTIVGPGGIGKTTVARALAGRLGGAYGDGAGFVDLSSLDKPEFVANAVASTLSYPVADYSTASLVRVLKDRHLLLVLDNCEHLIDAAAQIVVAIMRGAPRVHILATSREPLRVDGEWLRRLPGLETAPLSETMTASQALAYPAVQLFVERATQTMDSFEFTDADAPSVATICKRLDGIPLAIELAAATIESLGVRGLAAQLDNLFDVLTRGHRGAFPRHRTLRAAIDWSYGLLTPREATILNRLSVFRWRFTLEAAQSVVADDEIRRANVVAGLAELTSKSLVAADISQSVVQYRLLEVTRAYAAEKLKETDSAADVQRRHAQSLRKLLEAAERAWTGENGIVWIAEYGKWADDVSAALEWCYAPSGDGNLGADLTIASVPLWLRLSRMRECRELLERALARATEAGPVDPRREMGLRAGLGAALMYTGSDSARPSFVRTLELAQSLDDRDYRLLGHWGITINSYYGDDQRAAHEHAEAFSDLALQGPNSAEHRAAHRLMSAAHFMAGDLALARFHSDESLKRRPVSTEGVGATRFQLDQTMSAYFARARLLWVQGYPEQAIEAALRSVKSAERSGHALTLCFALADGLAQLALLTRNASLFEQTLDRFYTELAPYVAHYPRHLREGLESALAFDRNDRESAPGFVLTATPDAIGGTLRRFPGVVGRVAETMARAGRIADGLKIIDDGLLKGEASWCIPELLRAKGALVLLREPDAASVAEDIWRDSLAQARHRGAASWELRTATSVAQFWSARKRKAEAQDLLAPVYAKFTEGFDTGDLRAAKAVLDTL